MLSCFWKSTFKQNLCWREIIIIIENVCVSCKQKYTALIFRTDLVKSVTPTESVFNGFWH